VSSVIVIEERLGTRRLSLALATLWLLAVVVEVLLISLSSLNTPWVAIVAVAVAFVLLVMIFVGSLKIIVRVIDEPAGRTLEVLYGPGPIVCQRFRANEIEKASAHHLSFTQMGGWGYRGSLRFFKYAALSTRRGDALMVNLSGARRFVVTVDEPEAFAEALNTGRGAS
jgi:hypothetical protein